MEPTPPLETPTPAPAAHPLNPSCRAVRLRVVSESGDQRVDREWEAGSVAEVLELYKATT